MFLSLRVFKHCAKMSSCILLRLCLSIPGGAFMAGTYAHDDRMAILDYVLPLMKLNILVYPWATFGNKTIVSVVCFLEKC